MLIDAVRAPMSQPGEILSVEQQAATQQRNTATGLQQDTRLPLQSRCKLASWVLVNRTCKQPSLR